LAESAVTLAKENGKVARCRVRDGEVEVLVAIQVSDRHRQWFAPGAERSAFAERPVARTEEDIDVAGRGIANREVGNLIGVEVPDRYGSGFAHKRRLKHRWPEEGRRMQGLGYRKQQG
jgi:hypothetical protein